MNKFLNGLTDATNFGYTENGFDQIQDEIKDLKYNLNLLGHKLKIIEVTPNKIVYEDKNQIGYV